MNLKQAVEEIIDSFPKDVMFDSHVIINMISKNQKYYLAYLKEYSGKDWNINQFHGHIAKDIIGGLKEKVSPVTDNCISMNMFDIPSKNELWKKI